MDPSSSLLDSHNQAASTRSSSAQDVLAHASKTIAPPEQVASQRTPNAPSELVTPERITSAPPTAHNQCSIRTGCSTAHHFRSIRVGRSTAHHFRSIRAGRSTAHHFRSIRGGCPRARHEVAIEVDGDDSPAVFLLPLWDDLGRSYNLNFNLLHKFIPSFGFKETGTKPRSSSSSSSSRVMLSCLSCS